MLNVFGVPLDGENPHDAARRLLSRRYESLWGRAVPQIGIRRDGKPYFLDGSAFFSISHTKHFVFCALSDSEVGLDAEERRTVSPNAVSRILSPGEKAVCDTSSDPAAQFLQFWTLKEAYLKYTGKGVFSADLQSISFEVSGERPCLSGHPEVFLWSRQTGDLTVAVCSAQSLQPEFELPA